MTRRTHSFVVNGERLVYDSYGDGDRLLVYLHGLLLDSGMNEDIAEVLAERGNRVVLLDLLGHGRSSKPRHASAYRIDTYTAQVFALLDELGAEQAVLGGVSLGANVSLFAATEQPDRVRGLVLEMPVLERAVPFNALVFVPLLLLVHYVQPVLRWTSTAMRRVPDTSLGALNSLLHAVSLPPESMAAVLHGILVGPLAPTGEQRREISAPALVLGHRNDLMHPFNDAANLVDQLEYATLVRTRSPLELRMRPGRYADAISNFLDTVWGQARGTKASRNQVTKIGEGRRAREA